MRHDGNLRARGLRERLPEDAGEHTRLHGRLRGVRGGRVAFTLIELLVVVAIISLLVSILLPSLKKARDLAKVVVCAANMRQIGVGLQSYVVEENQYPYQATLVGTTLALEGAGLLHTLYNFSPEIFYCPSDTSNEAPTSIINSRGNRDNSSQTSYMYIESFYRATGIEIDLMDDTESASTRSILEDWYAGSPIYSVWGNHTPDGGNVAFLDGHVAWQHSDDPAWFYSANVYWP